MTNYLREQSAGEIIRNSFVIFGKGFRVIFLAYALPMLPFYIWQNEAQAAHLRGLYWLGVFVAGLMSLLASGAITISVSDICLGNKPSLARSYKKVARLFWKALTASLLQLIFILGGLVLLVVPGILALAWYLFTPCVIVLEETGGFTALKRSKILAQGFFWRNLGVVALLVVLWFVAYVLLGLPFLIFFPDEINHFSGRLFASVFQSFSTPLSFVTIVLLYYDLRVRKEAYDAAALAEDLRR